MLQIRDSSKKVKTYNDDNKPYINLLNASGDQMNIVDKGSCDTILDKVYGIKDLGNNLISGKRLCEKSLWVILPLHSTSTDIGVIVPDNKGKVLMFGDKNMVTNINQIGN